MGASLLALAKSIINFNQTVNLFSIIQVTLEHIHVTFEGKAKRFYRKMICKQSKIASYVYPQNSNHLRSHLRAIMALDYSRLIRPGKKSGRSFCVRQVYFTKTCQRIWVRVNQLFIP